MASKAVAIWRRLSLSQQFAVASFGIIVTSMMAVGWWVDREIESGVITTTAVLAAPYTTSFIAPRVQELAQQAELSPSERAALDLLMKESPLRERIVSFKVWARGGRIVYATNPSLIGKTFPLTEELTRAWKGEVASGLSDFKDEEDAPEQALGGALIETYAPVRAAGSDRVIAVAEFYEVADDLQARLFEASLKGWLIVALATLVIYLFLFGIVRRGNATIVSQRRELETQVRELSSLLAHNKVLQERIRTAASRASTINERFLRRISAELHDGPAQGIGFALLRLHDLHENRPDSDSASASPEWQTIRESLQDALREIRDISRGVALPELDHSTLGESVQRAVRAHERRTDTKVELTAEGLPPHAPLPLKLAVYRFIQEALNNAFRHGGGRCQMVDVSCTGGGLSVAVGDKGPGFDATLVDASEDNLGLSGMRERVESIGGVFELDTRPGAGTRVTALFPLPTEAECD